MKKTFHYECRVALAANSQIAATLILAAAPTKDNLILALSALKTELSKQHDELDEDDDELSLEALCEQISTLETLIELVAMSKDNSYHDKPTHRTTIVISCVQTTLGSVIVQPVTVWSPAA